MNPHVHAVSLGIEILAWMLGVPALLGLLVGSIAQLTRRDPAQRTNAGNMGSNPDAILMVLGGMSRVITWLAQILGALSGFLLRGVFWVSLVVFPVALVLFFTARGLNAGEPWARWLGSLFAAAFGFVTLLAALGLRGGRRLFVLLLTLVSGYALWALAWIGYAAG